MALHLTSHSNIVNKNLFQYLIKFMSDEQFLINAVITRISTSMSLIMQIFIYHMKMS